MEEPLTSSIFSKLVAAIFVLALADLVFINWWVVKGANTKSQSVGVGSESTVVVQNSTPSPTATPESLPSDKPVSVSSNSNSVVATPAPSPSQTVVQTPNKEIFIPMGSGQAKSSTFSDLPGVEVTIDTTKYSNIDYVVFEASIWVEGGNGRAWAQIKNVNDSNPLIESQISNPTSTPTLKTSGKIPLPTGARTYRVQAKTDLNEFAAHVENAHLKIVLK